MKAAEIEPAVRVETPGSPPWLWFFTVMPGMGNPISLAILIIYILVTALPQLGLLRQQAGSGAAFALAAVAFLLILLLVLAPNLLLLLGTMALFFPARRGKRLETQFSLGPLPAEIIPLGEIAAFVASVEPRIELRVNLLRTRELAFIYPIATQKPRLAVFGGLLRLWQRDREAAEAVLLHEIAHFRRGDYLHLGMGAGFEQASKAAFAIVLLDLIVVALLGLMNASMLMLLIFTAVATAQSLLTLISTVWAAEFVADNLPLDLGRRDGLLRAVEGAGERGSWLKRLLSRFSHPPVPLRRWHARLSAPARLTFSNFAVPALLVFRDLGAVLLLLAAFRLATRSGPLPEGVLSRQAIEFIPMGGAVMLALAILLPFWPRMHARQVKQFTGDTVLTAPVRRWDYLRASLMLLALLPLMVLNISIIEGIGEKLEPKFQFDFSQVPQIELPQVLPPVDPYGFSEQGLIPPEQLYGSEDYWQSLEVPVEDGSSTDSIFEYVPPMEEAPVDDSTVWDTWEGYGE